MNLKILLNEIKKEFAKIERISAVFLYGSYARGDYSIKHSDFDLLVFVDMKEVSERVKERVDNAIIPVGIRHSVKIHTEYQGTWIKSGDQTLVAKIVEEGKLIYSSGLLAISGKKMGLETFFLYGFRSSVRLSQILHGRKAWYYKGKTKVIKQYKGIIDNNSIIEAGRGALLVRSDKSKDVETMFDRLGVDYKVKKTLYG